MINYGETPFHSYSINCRCIYMYH